MRIEMLPYGLAGLGEMPVPSYPDTYEGEWGSAKNLNGALVARSCKQYLIDGTNEAQGYPPEQKRVLDPVTDCSWEPKLKQYVAPWGVSPVAKAAAGGFGLFAMVLGLGMTYFYWRRGEL